MNMNRGTTGQAEEEGVQRTDTIATIASLKVMRKCHYNVMGSHVKGDER